MRINSKTPEGKAKLELLLVDAILNQEPDMYEGNDYDVNQNRLDDYMAALSTLAEWHRQGKCSFTYDLWYKPYILHCIYVQWNVNADPNGLPEYSAKEMADLINRFDTLQLDKQEPFTWQLSSEIYIDTKQKEI